MRRVSGNSLRPLSTNPVRKVKLYRRCILRGVVACRGMGCCQLASQYCGYLTLRLKGVCQKRHASNFTLKC